MVDIGVTGKLFCTCKNCCNPLSKDLSFSIKPVKPISIGKISSFLTTYSTFFLYDNVLIKLFIHSGA